MEEELSRSSHFSPETAAPASLSEEENYSLTGEENREQA